MSRSTDDGWGAPGVGVFRYSRRAIELVWSTSRPLTLWLGLATVAAGLLPAAVAWVGQQIVDSVVAAMQSGGGYREALTWVAVEGGLLVLTAASQRSISLCQSLLRARLAQRVNTMILEKALTLSLDQFEDAEFYDKLTRARREASSRPLSLVNRTFSLAQNGISLVSYAVLLFQFSPWAVLLLVLAGLPAFAAETKFSGDAFRLFRWRSPESRMQMYLETVLAREDHAKEVKLFRLGPLLLDRYRDIFQRLYREDRRLTIRRETWGFFLGLIGTAAFYGAYAWIAVSTVDGSITLGQMTMYLLLFKQGQSAVAASLTAMGGMYEDNLYLSNLYEYLEQPGTVAGGDRTAGERPGDGIRFERVGFTYPGNETAALEHIDLHIAPGQSLALVGENGAGKTTLIKLMTGLYQPTEGRILLDGTPLADWDPDALSRRFGVIFQDFARYQFTVGENIGAGDVDHFVDEGRWREAAGLGLADAFIERLPAGYSSQLGKWFRDGQELSTGQWQKIALARAFMDRGADILIMDEPTASMDAAAEAAMFEHFQELAAGRITILISHRFSTVRRADRILVIQHGRVTEAGSHEELMALGGHYATLFSLQAEGYL
ncbi:ABC transporter ATP-binding protein [Lentisalinibacter sediminis]|uniref:ABC transporter ATP-binding protein n=1 Tax=Lentisalinibacter sediminis TaxID=2992237 RepID=UPI0038634EB7